MHFCNDGNMPTAHAISAVCAPALGALQVCACANCLHNNIAFNYNIAFLPNVCTQVQNIAILGHKFVAKTTLAAVDVIVQACHPDFGEE